VTLVGVGGVGMGGGVGLGDVRRGVGLVLVNSGLLRAGWGGGGCLALVGR